MEDRRKIITEWIKEFVGTILFVALLIVFCAFCIAVSGYHWE